MKRILKSLSFKVLLCGLMAILPLGILAGCKKDPGPIPNPQARAVVNNIVYEAIEGKKEYKVTGFDEEPTEGVAVVIPDTVGRVPVTEIADKAFYNTLITGVTIGKNVKSIGDETFAHSYSFASASVSAKNETFYSENDAIITKEDKVLVVGTLNAKNIPDGVTKIGAKAYYGTFRKYTEPCTINIPASVTEIGDYAFNRCAGIERVVIATGSNMTKVGKFAFFRNSDTNTDQRSKLIEIILPASVTEIGEKAFTGNAQLATVSIPGVKTLGAYAFSSCGITELTLSNTLETIGERAFENCSSLAQNIVLPQTLTTIGERAFFNSGITGINIPKEITIIKSDTFNGCSALATVTFDTGSKLTEIGVNAFRASGITALALPSEVVTINQYAVYNCKNLVTITLNAKLTTIAEEAFSNNGASLTSVITVENNSLREIPKNAFANAYKLETFDFANLKALEVIGESAFLKSSIVTVQLPNSMKTIKKSAFYACTKLAVVMLNSGLETIEQAAFAAENYNGAAMVAIWIPSSVTSIAAFDESASPIMGVFRYQNKMTIYIESETVPTSWPENFKQYAGKTPYQQNATVKTGYTLLEFIEEITQPEEE